MDFFFFFFWIWHQDFELSRKIQYRFFQSADRLAGRISILSSFDLELVLNGQSLTSTITWHSVILTGDWMIRFAYFCVIGEQLFHGLSRTYVSWTLQNPKLCGRSDLLLSFSLLLSEERVVGVGVMVWGCVCVWGGGSLFRSWKEMYG